MLSRNKNFKEKDREDLEKLIYHISHDLHEPVRTIARFFTLLTESALEKSKEGQESEYLKFIEGAIERMRNRIDGLVLYLQAENVKLQALSSVQVLEALTQAIQKLRKPIQTSKAKIQIEKSYPNVFADPNALQFIFYHLIENAIKFKSENLAPIIQVKGKKIEGDLAQFFVSDNGIGIQEEYFDKIYNLFQRLHPVDEYSGVGAGLGFVKRSLEYHGGSIKVQSKNALKGSSGSIFSFTLPTKKV